MNKDFNRWEFIEKNYSSVASKYLAGNYSSDQRCGMSSKGLTF